MKRKEKIFERANTIINVALICLPFIYVWFSFYASRVASPFFAKGNWIICLLFAVLYVLFASLYNGFNIIHSSKSETVYSQFLSYLITDVVLFIVIILLSKEVPSVWPILWALLLQFVLSLFSVKVSYHLFFKWFPKKKTCILYDKSSEYLRLFEKDVLKQRYDIKNAIQVKDCLEDLNQLDQYEVIVMCDIHSHDRNKLAKYCVINNKDVFMIPRIGDLLVASSKPIALCHLPFLNMSRYNVSYEYLFLKRFLDIIVSLIAIVILSPVMLVTALLIKMEDHGPVLYKQTRLTKDGAPFSIYKFRSMRVDAESDGVARLSTGDNDDRITKVGHVIRKCRVDELPQLFNILNGEMTLVGPRAERPEIYEIYEKDLPEFILRLQSKAGLTGYAQVYGQYNSTPYDKLQLDLLYLKNPNLINDLKIMIRTVKILFMSESTEGIEAGQVVAGSKKG